MDNVSSQTKNTSSRTNEYGLLVKEKILIALKNRNLTIEQIAGSLNVSQRTLQRKLQQSRLNYMNLVDEVRRDECMLLLASGISRISDIAEQLGYKEQTSFNHAFKRWTGSAPSR